MKKIISLIGVIAILFTMSVSVFAGDVPEELLNTDTAKVFIGTVENFTEKTIAGSSQVYIETVDVIPTEKIKGEVEIGAKETYTRCDSVLDLQKGKEYLFGYIDENNFYIYEILSKDKKMINLADAKKYDMALRLENYLNDGSFEKAEQERLAKTEQSTQPDNSSTSVIDGANEPTDIAVKSNVNVWLVVGTGALVLLLVIVFIIRKKKLYKN